LPSWRRSKPRRIWEDDTHSDIRAEKYFQEGLTVAGDASVIKGTRAQACIPPLLEKSRVAPGHRVDEDADDELSSESSVMDHSLYDNDSQRSASSPVGCLDDDIDMEQRSQVDVVEDYTTYGDGGNAGQAIYDRGAFTPVFEDDSPQRDAVSSPLGPMTPFGEFVDRAVAAAPGHSTSDIHLRMPLEKGGMCDGVEEPACPPLELPKEPALPEPVVTPSASAAYKKLSEPLSEWISNYIWKVCTTGMSLPAVFSRPQYVFLSHPFVSDVI
jgi:hypothetical protein